MALTPAVALAAATTRADALIAASPACAPYRAQLITAYQADLQFVFDALTANAEILPTGSPAMAAGGSSVTGKGKIT